jgi:hypothetical protein
VDFRGRGRDNHGVSHKALTLTGCILLLILPSAPADSCDCAAPRPLSNEVRTESPFIFEGRVIEIVERSEHTTRTTSGGGSGEVRPLGRQVVFEVRRAWNGVASKRISVSAEASDCMFPFAIDHTYVVFAGKDANGRPVTSICSRTSESGKAAEVLARLGPASVPK